MDRFTLIPAVHVFLIKDNKILLLRRFNTGYEDGNYTVPSGHLDGNESITNATIRETNEEACVDIQPQDVQVVHVMHRMSNQERVDFFLLATKWSGEPAIGEPNKSDEVTWYSLDDLPSNMLPYVRSALEKYQSGIFYSEFGWDE